jgi:ADP-heptose:LPS heptosyltransferase
MIIIHPGSGGSAINLSLQQYADLARSITSSVEAFFVITAGPGEENTAEQLSGLLQGLDHQVHRSTTGIVDFCKFIDCCDLFISGSTGPLHIAGALNAHTAAFYPSRRSATSLRWQTLNDETHRLAFSAQQDDMAAVDIDHAAADIIQLLQKR